MGKELAERLAFREQELMKYSKAFREREENLSKEKEEKQQLKVELDGLRHQLSQKDLVGLGFIRNPLEIRYLL